MFQDSSKASAPIHQVPTQCLTKDFTIALEQIDFPSVASP